MVLPSPRLMATVLALRILAGFRYLLVTIDSDALVSKTNLT